MANKSWLLVLGLAFVALSCSSEKSSPSSAGSPAPAPNKALNVQREPLGTGLKLESPDDRLFVAIMNDDLASTRKALDEGANPNAVITNPEVAKLRPPFTAGDSALGMAIYLCPLEVVELLVDKGAKPRFRAEDGESYEINLALYNTNVIQLFLERKLIGINDTIGSRGTMLHYAAYETNEKLAEFLAEKGADVNAKNTKGETPLDLAASRALNSDKAGDVIRLLMANGAKLPESAPTPTPEVVVYTEAPTGGDISTNIEVVQLEPIQLKPVIDEQMLKDAEEAKKKRDEEVARFQATQDLIKAAKSGNLKAVEAALKKGADLENGEFTAGRTPFLLAVDAGHFDMVKYLVNAKAVYTAVDSFGSNALHFAAQKNDLRIARYLLDLKKPEIAINATTQSGETPLDIALSQGKKAKALVKLLKTKGAKASSAF